MKKYICAVCGKEKTLKQFKVVFICKKCYPEWFKKRIEPFEEWN